ncbi:MAG: hypothetical protein VX248_08260 [Pseudomonadota bacterium]|nr:hypothetical protein [Pseudomonadota bacterium]
MKFGFYVTESYVSPIENVLIAKGYDLLSGSGQELQEFCRRTFPNMSAAVDIVQDQRTTASNPEDEDTYMIVLDVHMARGSEPTNKRSYSKTKTGWRIFVNLLHSEIFDTDGQEKPVDEMVQTMSAKIDRELERIAEKKAATRA